jgi:hypothetical protein
MKKILLLLLRTMMPGICIVLFSAGLLAAELQKPAGRTKYQVIEVIDGGEIVGKMKWVGTIPEVKQLVVNKDVKVCCSNDQAIKPSPRLIVSPKTRGVKNTVVYLAHISQGKKLEIPRVNPKLDQIECVYVPHVLIVPVGARLDMMSSDNILHNIHMFGAASYNLAFPLANKVITKRLRKPGVVEAACDAGHNWMSAFIHVMGHPYFALTDENGNFKLTAIPPGTYELQAWHEGWEIVKTEEKDGVITGYTYSEPIILKKEVIVPRNGKVKVTFELSSKAP